MPRPKNTYGTTDATRETLKDHVSQIASEYPCDASYIYAIKNGDATDPFPAFRHLFLACARAGAPVEQTYLRDLKSIVARVTGTGVGIANLADYLAQKIETDALSTAEILQGIRDFSLDRQECIRILNAIKKDREIDDAIEMVVTERLGELDEIDSK